MADISNVLTLDVSEAFIEAVSPTIDVVNNGDGTVTVTVTDAEGAETFNLGISSIVFNNDYTMTITLPDGTTYTSASLRGATGATGATGNGIASAVLNGNYTLTLTFTDGTTYTTPSIRGLQGQTGNGIANAVLNSNYTLTLNFTDGTAYTTTSIRGATGNGISSIYKTGETGTNPRVDEYTVLYTDGNTDTFNVTNGVKGDTGAIPAFSIGTVTTGAVGSDAAATITGTAAAPVLNLTLPRGATGDTTNIADVFSSSTAYSAGDYVIYNNLLYVFTADHAAGAWTGTDATQVTVGEELTSQKNDINKLINYGYCKSIAFTLEAGTISSSGANQNNAVNVRTVGYIQSDEPILFVRSNSSSTMGIYKYKSDGTYVTRSWFPSNENTLLISDVSGYKYRFIFSNSPQETVTDTILAKYKGWLFALTEESDVITDIDSRLDTAESGIEALNDRIDIPLNYGFKGIVGVDWSVGFIKSSTGEVMSGDSGIINNTPISLDGEIVIRKSKKNSILQIYKYINGTFARTGVDEGVYEYRFTADENATYRFCYYRTNPYETATVEDFIKDFNISYSTDEIIAPKRFSDVSGKKWVTIGDSLTATVTLSTEDETTNYTDMVAERLGLTLSNVGVSGSGYWRKSTVSPYQGFYQVANTIDTDADIVTVFGSFNDMGTDGDVSGRNILGTIYDETTDTVCGCMNQCFSNLVSRVPDAVIGVILPTPWNAMTRTESELTTYEAYTDLVKGVAERWSLPVLDLFHHSNLRPWDDTFKTTYYKDADGVHPNHYGHMRIAGYIADFVESLAKLN